jgi:CheY-like chemotaxis protein
MANSLSILLVEDHPDYQVLLVNALRSAGHAVTAASSKRTALEAAGKERFDIVLCDYRLGDGSGFDLMRDLKVRHGLRGICLSGYAEDEIPVSIGQDCGFDHFLVKGVSFEVIQAAILKVAAGSAAVPAAE